MQETAFSPLYTNDVTSEYLSDQDRPHFSEESIATFGPEALAQVRRSEGYRRAHPATGIFRVAAEGSQTRDGGVIVRGTLGMDFTLGDGREVAGARVGLRRLPRWHQGADRHRCWRSEQSNGIGRQSLE
jgi:hypothetical protein